MPPMMSSGYWLDSREGGDYLVLVETLWFPNAVETIVCWICAKIFRDRWRNRIAGPAIAWAHKYSREVDIPITTAQRWQIEEFLDWDFWTPRDAQ